MANVREGARRIKIVGQWTSLIAVSLAVCVFALQRPAVGSFIFALGIFSVPIVAGLALWATGWVLEGFTK